MHQSPLRLIAFLGVSIALLSAMACVAPDNGSTPSPNQDSINATLTARASEVAADATERAQLGLNEPSKKPSPPATPTPVPPIENCTVGNTACHLGHSIATALTSGNATSAASLIHSAGKPGASVACPSANPVGLNPLCGQHPGEQVTGILTLLDKGPAELIEPAAIAIQLKKSVLSQATGLSSTRGYQFHSFACPDPAKDGKMDCSNFFILGIQAAANQGRPPVLVFIFRRDGSAANLVGIYGSPTGISDYAVTSGGSWAIDWPPIGIPESWWFQPIAS